MTQLWQNPVSFRQLLDAMSQAVVLMDAQGQIRLVNRAAQRLTGYSLEELHAVDFKTILPAGVEASDRVPGIVRETQLRRKDGGTVWVRVEWQHFAAEDRMGWAAFLDDITQHKEVLQKEQQYTVLLDAEVKKRTEELRRQRTAALNMMQDAREDRQRAEAAETAAREGAQRVRAIIDAAQEAFISIDSRGCILEWNPQAERIFGWSKEEVLGRPLEETIIPSRHREAHVQGMKHFLQCGEGPVMNTLLELQAVHKSGREIPIELTVSNVKLWGENVFNSFIRDISERKKTQESILKLSRAVEQSPTTIVITDREGRIEYANPAFERISGYTVEEAKGKTPRVLKSGTHAPEFYQDLWSVITRGEIWRGEFLNKKKNGALYWEAATIAPVKSSDGTITHFVAVKENITAQKEAAQRLEELYSFQKAMLDYAGTSIITTTPDGLITSFNPGAEAILGYSADEVVGKKTPELIHDKDEVVKRAEMFSRELGREIRPGFEVFVVKARENLPNIYEWSYIRKDGSRCPVLLTVTALRSPSGEITGFMGVASDITEQKKAEVRMKQLMEDLRRSNQELEQFAYVASHDLQEPLRMVASYTQLLERRYKDQLDAKAGEFIRFAVDGAQRMQALISDLLQFSRVGTKGKPLTGISSAAACDAALVNLTVAIRESGARIHRGDLPEVVGDDVQLTQLFQNLIGNAIKYRGDRVPEVTVSCAEQPREWVFSISDNGIGIEPQYYERIFVIFQRLHTREAYSGTGIGLAVCKKIVERHGGRIWVESRPGEGSVFYFTLAKEPKKRIGELLVEDGLISQAELDERLKRQDGQT